MAAIIPDATREPMILLTELPQMKYAILKPTSSRLYLERFEGGKLHLDL